MEKQHPKQISWRIYGGATVITVFAFLAGVALAYLGLHYRIADVENNLTDLFVTMLSYQEITEMEDICNNKEYVQLLGEELGRIGEKLTIGEYPPYLLKYYTLMEISHLKIVDRLKRECNADVHWVIFFHGKDCSKCDAQGKILTYVKRRHLESVFIYAMDFHQNSPIVRSLKIKYDVNGIPAVVIDGRKYDGLLGAEDLEELIKFPSVKENNKGRENI